MSAFAPLRRGLATGCLGLTKPNPALLATLLLFFCAKPLVSADDPQPLLSGTVVDEAGNPVPAATITAKHITTNQQAVTGADGRFQFKVPVIHADRLFAILAAETPTGLLGSLYVQQEDDGQTPEPIKLTVKPGQRLEVTVEDAQGQPLAGAEVAFITNQSRFKGGLTDATGRWTGLVPSALKDWTVVAFQSNIGLDYATSARARGDVAATHTLPDQVTLKLDGARTFRVMTVDQDGRPLAGIRVGTWLIQKAGYEAEIKVSSTALKAPLTGDDGIAVIDWLPAKIARSWSIVSRPDKHYPLDHASFIPSDNTSEDLTIKLLPIEQISGRVTHADGTAGAGILVTAQGKGGGSNDGRATTRTDADGIYQLKAFSEQAYVVAIAGKEWAAPYRADIVVRAGKPVSGIDFVLQKPTRVHGRVTIGKDQPPAKTYLNLVIDKGRIPEELRPKDDRLWRPISMQFSAQTDADGYYEFYVGPGEYRLQGPARTEPVTITIPAGESPAEIVKNFQMPRALAGPLTIRVVDQQGQPLPGATLSGSYAARFSGRLFSPAKTNAQGIFKTERSLDPLVLHAITADQKLAGVIRSESEATEAEIIVGRLTTASGRLLDLDGQPLARKEITYGVNVYTGEPGRSPFSTSFGGKVKTDPQGRFRLVYLVPGQKYDCSIKLDEHASRTILTFTPDSIEPTDLGDVQADPNPDKPYVPPTPAERAAAAFARPQAPPKAKSATRLLLDDVLVSAEREYTRPLLLFGGPNNEACIELFRLFDERPEAGDKQTAQKPQNPYGMRWEFELLSLDDSQPEVRDLAAQLGVKLSPEPILVVLTGAGSLTATYPLRLSGGKLDPAPLTQFLALHKLPTRDAQKMLADGLRRAQTEDKFLFFIFSASWCGPCRSLSAFLAKHNQLLDPHYIFVKLDVSRDDHANALRDQYKQAQTGGVPWFTILDSQGNSLITSNDPKADSAARFGNTNIGFPSEQPSIDHFLTMLKTTSPRLLAAHLSELRAALLKPE